MLIIDTHSHILPGIDDGAGNIEESLKMLRIAMENDIREIVATPHYMVGSWQPTWQEISLSCIELNKKAQENGLKVAIYPGSEIYMDMEFLDVLACLDSGSYCLNKGAYMLVEMPVTGLLHSAEQFIFCLQARGIIPVLAHIERYQYLYDDCKLLKKWRDRGIKCHVNGGSLTGLWGRSVQRRATNLVCSGYVDVVASDAHGIGGRKPNLSEARAKVTDISNGLAQMLFYDNPKRILENQELLVPWVVEKRYSNSLVKKLFTLLKK